MLMLVSVEIEVCKRGNVFIVKTFMVDASFDQLGSRVRISPCAIFRSVSIEIRNSSGIESI